MIRDDILVSRLYGEYVLGIILAKGEDQTGYAEVRCPSSKKANEIFEKLKEKIEKGEIRYGNQESREEREEKNCSGC